MVELTGVHDLTRASADLAYLFNLGLIRRNFDFSSYHEADSYDVTPSSLGLELYKHCHGSRERVRQDLVENAANHLASFFPQPLIEDGESHLPPSHLAF
jgi:hypothetical protein